MKDYLSPKIISDEPSNWSWNKNIDVPVGKEWTIINPSFVSDTIYSAVVGKNNRIWLCGYGGPSIHYSDDLFETIETITFLNDGVFILANDVGDVVVFRSWFYGEPHSISHDNGLTWDDFYISDYGDYKDFAVFGHFGRGPHAIKLNNEEFLISGNYVTEDGLTEVLSVCKCRFSDGQVLTQSHVYEEQRLGAYIESMKLTGSNSLVVSSHVATTPKKSFVHISSDLDNEYYTKTLEYDARIDISLDSIDTRYVIGFFYPFSSGVSTIKKSTNGGNTWVDILTLDDNDPGQICMLSKKVYLWWDWWTEAIYRTEDSGQTWSLVFEDEENSIDDICFIKLNDGSVMAFCDRFDYGLGTYVQSIIRSIV